MTHRRLCALLALPILALAAVPATADGAHPAAVTSFRLLDGAQEQEVDLVAVREDDQDLLLLRTSACDERGCAGDERLVRLTDGQLVITDNAARLRVELGGRNLQVTWSLAGGGIRLSGARFRSDGSGGDSTADGFAGRTAKAHVRLGAAQCTTTGALGTAVRVASEDRLADRALGQGDLNCPAG